jgi:hypothetical protein
VAILFDVTSFFEYYTHMRAGGRAKVPFRKALESINIKGALEKVGKVLKAGDTIYLVPSVTGHKGVVEIDGKKFYEY